MQQLGRATQRTRIGTPREDPQQFDPSPLSNFAALRTDFAVRSWARAPQTFDTPPGGPVA